MAVSHGRQPWLTAIVPWLQMIISILFSVKTTYTCKLFFFWSSLAMAVSNGCQQRLSAMAVSNGCQQWLSTMAVSNGCQQCLSAMACQQWLSAMAVSNAVVVAVLSSRQKRPFFRVLDKTDVIMRTSAKKRFRWSKFQLKRS